MRPRAPEKPNHHELFARSAKVAKFVVSFEAVCRREGIDTVKRVDEIVGALARWSDEEWRRAFVIRGLKPPSKTTQRAVIEALRMRALDARRERWVS